MYQHNILHVVFVTPWFVVEARSVLLAHELKENLPHQSYKADLHKMAFHINQNIRYKKTYFHRQCYHFFMNDNQNNDYNLVENWVSDTLDSKVFTQSMRTLVDKKLFYNSYIIYEINSRCYRTVSYPIFSWDTNLLIMFDYCAQEQKFTRFFFIK